MKNLLLGGPWALAVLMVACSSPGPTLPNTGVWRASLSLNGHPCPFLFYLTHQENTYEATLVNANERIVVTDILHKSDSLIFPYG